MNAASRRPWTPSILVLICLGCALGPSLFAVADASATPTREAVVVWQHRGPASAGWDIWFSVLSRPHPTFPMATSAWRPARPLAELEGDDKNPEVATNPISGVTMAVWQHREPDGEWEIYVSELSFVDDAPTWTAPEPLFDGTWDDLDPAITVDTNGTAIAAWVYAPPAGDRDLVFAVYNPLGMWVFGGLVAGLEASLPEIVFSSAPATGGIHDHQAVVVWTDYLSVLDVHKMHTTTYDGMSWGTVMEIESPAGVMPPTIDDVAFATYLDGAPDGAGYERGDPDDFNAYGQSGIAADGSGRVFVLWGGGITLLGNLWADGLVGAFLDVATGSWSPILTDTGSRTLGTLGSELPDCTVVTPKGQVVGVYEDAILADSAVYYTYSPADPTVGTFLYGNIAFDGPANERRPTVGALSPREVVAACWDGLAVPPDTNSRITWSFGVTRPTVPDVVWASRETLYGNLETEDLFPDLATGYGSLLTTLELRLDPDHGFAAIGEEHTVVATLLLSDAPLEGIEIEFEIRGANPQLGSDTTDAAGQATFSYGGAFAGEDSVLAAVQMGLLAVGDHAPMRWVTPDAVEEIPGMGRVRLLPNRPNPFNPITEIRFELARRTRPTLEFFDARGRRVLSAELPELAEGMHRWTWDGRDQDGRTLPSGVYRVRLTAGEETDAHSVVLAK